jgi:hypothetical protein
MRATDEETASMLQTELRMQRYAVILLVSLGVTLVVAFDQGWLYESDDSSAAQNRVVDAVQADRSGVVPESVSTAEAAGGERLLAAAERRLQAERLRRRRVLEAALHRRQAAKAAEGSPRMSVPVETRPLSQPATVPTRMASYQPPPPPPPPSDEVAPPVPPPAPPPVAPAPVAPPPAPSAAPTAPPAAAPPVRATPPQPVQPPGGSAGASTNAAGDDDERRRRQQEKERAQRSDESAKESPQPPEAPESMGVPPPRPQPQFLRDNSVLLEPGQYQFETGFVYTSNVTRSVISETLDDQLLVGSLSTTNRNLQIPLEFRIGVNRDLQASFSLPIGFVNQELSLGSSKLSDDTVGIGDLGINLTRVLSQGKGGKPNILGNIGLSAPTGSTSVPSVQQQPGINLGNGFWMVNVGFTVVKQIDPVAFFGGLTYVKTFDTDLSESIRLTPGDLIAYRFGVGYAINSRVSLSTGFDGSFIGELKVNDRVIPGSAREPFALRLAATLQSDQPKSARQEKRLPRTTEPFVRFGLSEAAPDIGFGVRLTY